LYDRNSSPSWPSTATSATSSAGLSHAPSPTPTTLSALDSSQFQETLSESNPEVSRASIPQSTTTKTKRKRTAWVYSHMVGTTDMQVLGLGLLRMNTLIIVLSQPSRYTMLVIGGYIPLSSNYILI
jgi:hypothetical protein